MQSRVITVGIVLFWAWSMAWLIEHDIVPAWTARDVPKFDGGAWLGDDMLRSQARIEDRHGRRLGTVWTEYAREDDRLSRSDVIWTENFGPAPHLRIQIASTFVAEGNLDEMRLRVYGIGERVEVVAEDFSGHLAFELRLGARKAQRFKVDAAVRGTVGDVFRPFPTLPRIEVGQSWRMHVFNPLAAISGIGRKLMPMLVRVTRKERIATDDGSAECFVVETEMARAWVDERGVVLRQEMDLPVGGTLMIVAEPFDGAARDAALAVPLPSGGM